MPTGYQRLLNKHWSAVQAWQSRWRRWPQRAIAILLWVIFAFAPSLHSALATTDPQAPASLPVPQIHPLPVALAQWQDHTNQGNYFDEIQPTKLGYLIWSQFPIKVYVERPDANPEGNNPHVRRWQEWTTAVLKAVQDWNVCLPLTVVEQADVADIMIQRSPLPLRSGTSQNPLQSPLRVRSAETRYEFYLRADGDRQILRHRSTIVLNPNQTTRYIEAAARHELGHALGIWGHSPQATDVMYFSQVRNPEGISRRDRNTLKKIYEQPTRLGWPLRQ